MKKLLITILIAITAWAGFGMLSPAPVSAAPPCNDRTFLTFYPWYRGLVNEDADCSFRKVVAESPTGDEITLGAFIWTIIINILSILFGIIGYLAIGFLIFGGYLYVLARGDPGRIAKGKSTVIRAIIGLIVCILASLISNLIVTIITEATHA